MTTTVGREGAPGGAAASDKPAEESAAVELRQLSTLFQQYRRVPYPVLLITAYLAYLCYGSVENEALAIWTLVNIAFPLVRLLVVTQFVADDAKIASRRTLALSVARSAAISGLCIGVYAPLFFPTLALDTQSIVTMVLCCLVAGGLGASGSYPPAFYGFSLGVIGPLLTAWALTGRPDRLAICVLLACLLIIFLLFVREQSELVVESIRIRFERDRVLADQMALVTRLREAHAVSEDLRKQAEDLSRSKSRFLAAASHDLRQPLHAISLLVGLLGTQEGEAADARVVGQLRRSVASLDALFAALLDLSKFDAGAVDMRPEPVTLEALFGGLAAEIGEQARARGLGFAVHLGPGTAVVDRVLLQRAARNLLDNAIKYTESGTVAFRAEMADGRLDIEVSDTGRGIPEREREAVFEEFYQLDNPNRDRAGGLGLGLAIIRRICDLAGGRVNVVANVPHGTRFNLTVPSLIGQTSSVTPNPSIVGEVQLNALRGKRVIAIDDDPEVRMALSLVFERWGAEAMVCESLAGALGWERTHDQPPEVVLCDLRLGGGDNGVTVLKRLRERWPRVQGIVVTGDVEREALELAQAAGFRMVHKPLDERKLRAAMIR
jgi:two-component system, sensor histidine kinase